MIGVFEDEGSELRSLYLYVFLLIEAVARHSHFRSGFEANFLRTDAHRSDEAYLHRKCVRCPAQLIVLFFSQYVKQLGRRFRDVFDVRLRAERSVSFIRYRTQFCRRFRRQLERLVNHCNQSNGCWLLTDTRATFRM